MIGQLKCKILTISNIDEDVEQLEELHFVAVPRGHKMVQPLWKTMWHSLQKFSIH